MPSTSTSAMRKPAAKPDGSAAMGAAASATGSTGRVAPHRQAPTRRGTRRPQAGQTRLKPASGMSGPS